MPARLVLDLSDVQKEALISMIQRLSSLVPKPEIVVGKDVELHSGDLLVTEDSDHTATAVQGARVWRVQAGVGELETWDDLPLAWAFAHGTLEELTPVLAERPELGGESIRSLAWTPKGDVTGTTNQGTPIFATAGPDGENPQVFVGPEALEREKEAHLYVRSLIDNGRVSQGEPPGPGQTHVQTKSKAGRPILRRDRFA